MNQLNLFSSSEDATEELGQAVGCELRAGDCVVLSGQLGAGKTTLTRGLARGMAISDRVSSPSYLLCHEYSGDPPLLHLDAYFQERISSLLHDGLAERFNQAVVVVEWGEQISDWLPADRLELLLEAEVEPEKGPEEQCRRKIQLNAGGERSSQLLIAISAQLDSLGSGLSTKIWPEA